MLAFWHSPPRTEIRLMPLSLGTRRHLPSTAFCSDYETLLRTQHLKLTVESSAKVSDCV